MACNVPALHCMWSTYRDVGETLSFCPSVVLQYGQGASRLRRLTVARHELNLWRCGCYSSEGLLDFRATRPDVTIRLVSV